ncbi:MAG TPA: MBL fold metallo-hydrolase [Gammaproteobacteria bacterium]|nr:MBL fold metallo-hydrolase [Gammaproteobacteria bacterium]
MRRAPFIVAFCALLIASASAFAAKPGIRVMMLGTGSPAPRIERFGPSTLVEAGGQELLFDCGRGTTQRLWQLHIPLSAVTAVFFTHLHSDHTVGFPDLWLTGWLPTPFGRRTRPMQVFGPTGTEAMMASLKKAFGADIRIRHDGEGLPLAGVAIRAEDISQGVVYERDGVKVTAFDVFHGPFIKPAFGYRVDYGGRSVVISGDTHGNENLIRFSKGADVVVHEVAMAKTELLRKSATARRIIGFHTTPEAAGKVFAQIKPKLAVYTHVVLLTTDPVIRAPTVQDLIAQTRKTWSGPLAVGEDLMTIEIGSTVNVSHGSAR